MGTPPPGSFLKERLLSRQRSSKRSTILVLLWFSRPDCDRAPSPRLGQGRRSRRRGALTLPTRESACWRRSRRDSGDRHYLLFGGRDTGCRLQVRSVLREGKALTRLPVIPAPFDGMECCGTTRRGQSQQRPRRGTGGHDLGRPRALWCRFRVTPPPRWPWIGWCRPEGRSRRG
jgi:hypothetical protein